MGLRKMFGKIANTVCQCSCGGGGGADGLESDGVAVHGTVVLMTKNVLDFNDFTAVLLDGISDLLGRKVSFQLVSATVGDPNNGNKGVVGKPAYLEKTVKLPSVEAAESKYQITFQWEENYGVPGAFIVKNKHDTQFYLKSLTLEDFPGAAEPIHFVCNSWVYPADKYSYDRVFFANNTYLPANTPEALRPYRRQELYYLRGDGIDRQLQEWDRIYQYDYYNDLANPDESESLARPVLGGSDEYPYPRRGKTGRPPTKADPNSESKLPLVQGEIYVPRDERFGHLKLSDFLANAIKAIVVAVFPILESIFNATPNEFDSFDDVLKLYEGGLELPQSPLLDQLRQAIPFEFIKQILQPDSSQLLKLPMPLVIHEDKWAWRTDEEFTREMLAGVNPVIIRRLQEFPPTSNLDTNQYGNQNSTITAGHIEKNLDGLSVEQALNNNRLFILDHHDMLMPYVNLINSNTFSKIYATRTLLFLNDDSTLRPLVIELSLPHPDGEQYGVESKVYTPAQTGVDASIWQLAKAYATVNDSGVHQLISHWLNTHAAIEPFVIATNRQLSAMHPIYKLLEPHYRDTMNINALARQILINAGGILEATVFPSKYAMEMSSKVYKNWNFVEQGLPSDLLKRGMAVEDPKSEHGLRLLIKDYPYAVDGLSVWSAIQTWVTDYCTIYYPNDQTVLSDAELQAWWKDVRDVGHGDKQNETWWPQMTSVADLTLSCTTIIWIASALHAAVNFGQYPYAGYLPNRPTISRRFMPEPGTPEYDELTTNPDKVLLKTITSQVQTIIGISLIEILSTHSTDEVYLGQRDTAQWTADQKALHAFEKFGAAVAEVEQSVRQRNANKELKNRNGPVKIPYTLLYPTSEPGITAMGIPNSVSI